MEKHIQDKLDAMYALAKTSATNPARLPSSKKKGGVSDWLSRAIKTQDEADLLMAKFEMLTKLEKKKQERAALKQATSLDQQGSLE
jgi:hypothetical protein